MNTLNDKFNEHLQNMGEIVLIDGVENTVFFMTSPTGATQLNEFIYLFAFKGVCEQGSLINRNGTYYLVYHKEPEINEVYEKFLLRDITKFTNFVIGDELKEIPSIIFDGSQTVRENNSMAYFDGKLELLVPKNADTTQIIENDRFICFGNAWLVVGTTEVNRGYLNIYAEKTQVNEDDNIIDEIPSTYTPPVPEPTETYSIDGVAEIKTGQTVTYTGTKTVDGSVVASVWVFTLEDNGNDVQLVVVDDNTCDITSNESSGTVVLSGVCDGETVVKEIALKGLW